MSIDIKLEAFEGPLDLLLHLITREELDIYDIPIVSITSQYLEVIDNLSNLDLDTATEFIVMAATLIEIKSRMLLPDRNDMEVFDYSNEDPRRELVKRLVEYKQFKEIASLLRETEGTLDEVVFKEQSDLSQYVDHVSKETLNESMDQMLLVEAIQRVLVKINRFDDGRQKYFKGIKRDAHTVDDKLSKIRNRILTEECFEFSTLFDAFITREEVVVTFLAILEMLKLKEIRIVQETIFGEISIRKRALEDRQEELVDEDEADESTQVIMTDL